MIVLVLPIFFGMELFRFPNFVCCWHHSLRYPTLILLWDEKGAAGVKSVCRADDSKTTVIGVIRISMAEKETCLLNSNNKSYCFNYQRRRQKQEQYLCNCII